LIDDLMFLYPIYLKLFVY